MGTPNRVGYIIIDANMNRKVRSSASHHFFLVAFFINATKLFCPVRLMIVFVVKLNLMNGHKGVIKVKVCVYKLIDLRL